MTDGIADKYEAIRRKLVPSRNTHSNPYIKTRLTILIENCTLIAMTNGTERADLIEMFNRNLADFEKYVGKLPPYGEG